MKKTPFGAFLTPALTGRPPAEIRIERSLLRVARTSKRIYTTQTQPECEGGRNFSQSRRGLVYPTLSEQRNIVVIADEAHRTQYDFVDGFARHMRDALPNASFIGFQLSWPLKSCAQRRVTVTSTSRVLGTVR